MSKLKFFLLALSFILATPFLALAEDSLTITTYYPSPYGTYNKLQSNRLAVGDTNADSEMTSADLPSADGQIYAARSVIYKPQSSLPATDLVTGELAYNSSDSSLYLYNGSAWAAVGSGTAVMNLSCAWGTDYTAGAAHGWDGSCTPPSCPADWISVATFSEPLSVACSGDDYACYWDNEHSHMHPVAVGRSVRVCTK